MSFDMSFDMSFNMSFNTSLSMSEKIHEFKRPNIVKTKDLKIPNEYTLALDGECRQYAFNEERAPLNKGLWRSDVFRCEDQKPIDLEIGTGNGRFFQHQCLNYSDRNWVGVELKYKPLIQTIRGVLRNNCQNGRVMRTHAFNLDTIFQPNEINNIYVHFPDPWVTPRKPKNRIFTPRMLDLLWDIQRNDSFVNFKTDSEELYRWSLLNVEKSKYNLIDKTEDLHNSQWKETNFETQFEKIFLKKGQKIFFFRLQKRNSI